MFNEFLTCFMYTKFPFTLYFHISLCRLYGFLLSLLFNLIVSAEICRSSLHPLVSKDFWCVSFLKTFMYVN